MMTSVWTTGCGRTALWVAVALAGAAWAAAAVAQDPLLPVQDVRLPLARYPDGSIQRQLHAERAAMNETGPIKARNVCVESFDPDGKLEMVVEAVACEYDRDQGTIHSVDAVKARGRGMTLTGEGFSWDVKSEQLRVLKDARVEFTRKQRGGKSE